MTCKVLLSQKVHTPGAAHPTQSVLKKLASDEGQALYPAVRRRGRDGEAGGAGPPITKLKNPGYIRQDG
jgi:hypothetical protein